MDTPNEIITPSSSHNSNYILFILAGLFLLAVGLVTGYYLGSKKATTLTKIASISPTPSPVQDGRPWPKTLSEQKNIKIGKRSPEIGIRFEGMENTTYDKTEYEFDDKTYTIRALNKLPNAIEGQIKNLASDYLIFVYEGFEIKPTDILLKQLEQSNGHYPTTIYNTPYEIFTNKNGIKMKRQYLSWPGYKAYKVEFTMPTPADSKSPTKYYSFMTGIPLSNKQYNSINFDTNPNLWTKQNQVTEFVALHKFIDTITN